MGEQNSVEIKGIAEEEEVDPNPVVSILHEDIDTTSRFGKFPQATVTLDVTTSEYGDDEGASIEVKTYGHMSMKSAIAALQKAAELIFRRVVSDAIKAEREWVGEKPRAPYDERHGSLLMELPPRSIVLPPLEDESEALAKEPITIEDVKM